MSTDISESNEIADAGEELSERRLYMGDKTMGTVIEVAKQFIPDLDPEKDFIQIAIFNNLMTVRRRAPYYSPTDILRHVILAGNGRVESSPTHQSYYDFVAWEMWGSNTPCVFRSLRIPLEDGHRLNAGLVVPLVMDFLRANCDTGLRRELQTAIEMIPTAAPSSQDALVAQWLAYVRRFSCGLSVILTVDPASMLPFRSGTGYMYIEPL